MVKGVVPDELDKRILQKMSKGISSYDELAHNCGVTRSTIYRRVAMLEKNGFLRKATRSVVNYEKLDIVTIFVTIRVAQISQEKILKVFKSNNTLKFLWRTYGHYNIVAVFFCSRGNEGEIINEIMTVLERYAAVEVHVSVGFTWEKMEFTPFSEASHETQAVPIAQKTNNQSSFRTKNTSHATN
jgi:DNA-binding Lrp family transcriptional regulator